MAKVSMAAPAVAHTVPADCDAVDGAVAHPPNPTKKPIKIHDLRIFTP